MFLVLLITCNYSAVCKGDLGEIKYLYKKLVNNILRSQRGQTFLPFSSTIKTNVRPLRGRFGTLILRFLQMFDLSEVVLGHLYCDFYKCLTSPRSKSQKGINYHHFEQKSGFIVAITYNANHGLRFLID
jgi:hypothetical protein